MNHQFKPGDLAIIKQCKTWPAATGRCVELIEQVPPKSDAVHDGRLFHNTSDESAWLVSHGDGFPVHSVLYGLCTDLLKPVALFREQLLMPLRGDENPDAHLATSAPRQAVTA